jgi:hypothetical protein
MPPKKVELAIELSEFVFKLREAVKSRDERRVKKDRKIIKRNKTT